MSLAEHPNTCVKIYEKTGVTLRHQLDNYVNDLKVKSCLTSQIGNFRFTLPSKQGSDSAYLFNDIVPHDKILIWIKDGAINPAVDEPKMVGRVRAIQSQGNSDALTKVVSGLDQGEVLLRLIAFQKHWAAISAHTIVDAICAACGLTDTEISACATTINVDADNQTWFDVLKTVSDYWYAAASKIQRDWYVNKDNKLYWKTRPIRSAGVEVLTYGTDFVNYALLNDGNDIKNKIYVFGKKVQFNAKDPSNIGRKYPADGDEYTYKNDWTATTGTVTQELATPKVGSDCCMMSVEAGTYQVNVQHSFPVITVEGNAGYSMLEFWWRRHGVLDAAALKVRILAPDTSNYYQATVADCAAEDVWEYIIRAIGQNNTYNAITNPSGEWTATGSPTWFNIQGVQFITQQFANSSLWELDGLCFSFGRWRDTSEDGTSQTNYGVREHVVIDDDLASDSDCECRGETLLYQLKDPVKRLDIQVQGHLDILIGDRLSITLPPENISATSFDVVATEHIVSPIWFNAVTLLDSADHRVPPPNSFAAAVMHGLARVTTVSRGVQTIGK